MEEEARPETARGLRVCCFGTYRSEYSRNRIRTEGLRQSGAEVVECHVPLWHGVEDRVQAASGGWLRPAFLFRAANAYLRLLRLHHRTPEYDVMLLGYPGQLDAFLARLLTWARRRPLALDVFMSTYLIAIERGLVARHPLTGRLLFWLEKLAYRLPDRLIHDTPEYVQWLCTTFGLKPERFRLVPTGADDSVFRPAEGPSRPDGTLRVVYYGSFIANHGVGTIVEAARLLQNRSGIQFELIGDGPERAGAERRSREWRLSNVAFRPWMEQGALVESVGRADLCLGAFGTTPQSVMTVHNKVYEALAMRLCVVTGDSPAVRRALEHGKEIWLCDRLNPEALAAAVLTLQADPALRSAIGEQGYRAFLSRYSTRILGAQWRGHLDELRGVVKR